MIKIKGLLLFCFILSAQFTQFPKNETLPLRVHTAVQIKELQEITSHSFYAHVLIRLRWKDSRLAFNERNEGLERKELNNDQSLDFLNTHWHPQIRILNQTGEGDDYQYGMFIYHTGDIELIYRIASPFKTSLNYHQFPFDAQSLSIELASEQYNEQQLQFIHDDSDRLKSGFSRDFSLENWVTERINYQTVSYKEWNDAFHHKVQIQINVSRIWQNYILQIFLPLFSIMMFPLITIWSENSGVLDKANITLTALLAMIALNFSISQSYPGIDFVNNAIIRLFWVAYFYLALVLVFILTLLNPMFEENFLNKYVYHFFNNSILDLHMIREINRVLSWVTPITYAVVSFSVILGSIA